MKYENLYTMGVCLVAGVIAVPSKSQTTPDVPQVHVETHAETRVETPEVRVEAPQVRVEIPDVHVATTVISTLDDDEQSSGTTRSRTKALTERTRALQQYVTGQTYQNLTTALGYTPEMAKKTREIALLRQMLALRLTARDYERAIPLLKELKEQDTVVPVKPEQAVDEEIQALLRARPGDPMPPSSADALRDAAKGSRSHKQEVWEKMAQEIGREKANGIRGMLRSEGFSVWSANGFPRTLIAPGALTPLRGQIQRAQPAAPPVPPARESREPRTDAPEVNPAKPDNEDETPVPAPRADSAPRRSTRGQRTTPTAPPTSVYTVPGSNGQIYRFNGNNRIAFSWSGYGQASLDELIDLFERKLAAMRH
jgi:hypothetical protein